MNTFLVSENLYNQATLPSDHAQIVDELEKFTRDILAKPGSQVANKWTKASDYHLQIPSGSQLVETFNAYNQSDFWSCRYSKHKDIDEDTYRSKIVGILNGSEYDSDMKEWRLPEDLSKRCRLEPEYIHDIEEVKILQDNVKRDENGGWVHLQNIYKLNSVLKKREFNVWVYVVKPFKNLNDETETSYVVSIRSDYNKDDDFNSGCVRAYYVSIEKLKYDYSSKQFEWLMGTASDCKGFVPMFVQKLGINKAVVQDVPSFFNYIG